MRTKDNLLNILRSLTGTARNVGFVLLNFTQSWGISLNFLLGYDKARVTHSIQASVMHGSAGPMRLGESAEMAGIQTLQ